MLSSLQTYRRCNRYSQNGEDGVIAEILRRLRIDSGWFCEFGAWDGRYGSNCYALLRDGWRGVMIEGEPLRCRQLFKLAKRYPQRLHALNSFVEHSPTSPRTLDRLLSGTPIPKDFALLSIDIDSYDYHVWESVERYHPVIVVIEIVSSIPPGPQLIHGASRDGIVQNGTSFSAMLELGRRKGYSLACHTGNMIFVRDDHFERLGLPAREREYPELLFVGDWLNPTRLQRLQRKIHYMTWQRAWVKLANALAGLPSSDPPAAQPAVREGMG